MTKDELETKVAELENRIETLEAQKEAVEAEYEADAVHLKNWIETVLHKYHTNDEPARAAAVE